MPDRPRIRPPGRVRVNVPRRPVPTPPTPSPRPTRSARAGYKRQIKLLLQKLRSVESEFYAVGTALRKLDRPEVIATFGYPTFRAFVDAEVMPYDKAYRYMTIAGAYPKRVALSLGVEKGFHLVQYAKVAETLVTARQLVEQDSRIGTGGRRVSQLTAGDVQNLVRVMKMSAAKAEVPKATRVEKRAVRSLVSQFEDRFGVDASARIDKKKGVVRLEIKLADLIGGR